MGERRFYWMKFQRDFFSSLRIKKLRRLAGGDTYTIIYLKLQLLSIASEGYLTFKHILETFEEEMSEEIDEDIENVRVTISYLLACGLMIQTEDVYFLPYAAENIGSESASTQRVRDYRKRQKALHCNETVTEVKRLGNVEIDIEKEIDIDKDSINNIPAPKEKKVKHKHGEYQHVLLTDDEFNKLATDYGENVRDRAITFLDEYIEEKGYKSKSHNLAIRRWVIDAVKKGRRNGDTGKQNYNTGVQSQYSELDSIERLNRLG